MHATAALLATILALQGGVPEHWPGELLIPDLLARHQLDVVYRNLLADLKKFGEPQKGTSLLGTTAAMQADPLSVPGTALTITDELVLAAKEKGGDLVRCLLEAAKRLDVPFEPEPVDLKTGLPGDEHLEQIESVLDRANAHLNKAFLPLSEEQRELLAEGLPGLAHDFTEHIYIHEKERRDVLAFRAAEKVDRVELFRAAAAVVALADPIFLAALKKDLSARPPKSKAKDVKGLKGLVLGGRDTKYGPIVVLGTGPDRIERPCAMVIDLGGSDFYGDGAAASGPGRPFGIVLDFEGKDTYRTSGDLAQGAGFLGIGLLVDQAGDDVYEANRLAQGFGTGGIGILLDRSGNDRYIGDAFVQGAASAGTGFLLDLAGNDRMEAKGFAQGFGTSLSFGTLVDVAGDDVRVATGRFPSHYGTAGEWNGMSQGASVGYRTIACGGFGVLVDGGGKDSSKVGEFGLGIGYFFGTGIARDLSGDDEWIASRYGLATGAHMGIGVVIDDKGNDTYKDHSTASLSGDWDLTITFLIDRQGDDTYSGAGITLGSSTITSFAAFIDGKGSDRYSASGSDVSFAASGHKEDGDRSSTSLGLFLDLGGGKDQYASFAVTPPPADGLDVVRRRKLEEKEIGVGLFFDR